MEESQKEKKTEENEENQKVKKIGENVTFEESDESKLGEGGFGVVFRGKNTKTEKDVAIKRVEPENLKEDELVVVRQLNNPFVVGYIDVVYEPDFCYVVMELMDQDLGLFIDQHSKLLPQNLATVAKHVAQGYLALHEKLIVHRDLKPQNILLKLGPPNLSAGGDDSGSEPRRKLSIANIARKISRPQTSLQIPQPRIFCAKISDFGTSRQTIDEETANLAGTLCYMAPEVGANLVDRNEYGQSADMWSIGVVLYEALTGKLPFDEGALCKLFLVASAQNYHAYDPPNLKEGGKKYKPLLPRLLDIDPEKRLPARAFHDYIVYDHALPPTPPPDEDTVSTISRFSRRSRYSSQRSREREGITHKLDEQFVKHEMSEISMEWNQNVELSTACGCALSAHATTCT